MHSRRCVREADEPDHQSGRQRRFRDERAAEIPTSGRSLPPTSWSANISARPAFRRRDETGKPLRDASGNVVTGPEKSAEAGRQSPGGLLAVLGREARLFRHRRGRAGVLRRDLPTCCCTRCAPRTARSGSTPGLNCAYGITGPAQGHFYCDPKTGELLKSRDAYSHPQPHACQPYFAPISTPKGAIRIGKIVEQNMIGLEVFDGTDEGRGHHPRRRRASATARSWSTARSTVQRDCRLSHRRPSGLLRFRRVRRSRSGARSATCAAATSSSSASRSRSRCPGLFRRSAPPRRPSRLHGEGDVSDEPDRSRWC